MGRPAKFSRDQERINLVVEPPLRLAIKRWRHRKMIDTEGEAVRRLLETALAVEGEQIQPVS